MSRVLRDRFSAVDLALPQITFTDRMTLDLGNLSLHLIPYGGGHSISDILIVVPEEGLLISGDVFFHRQLPLVTGDGTPDPDRWLTALDILDEQTKIQTVIPGHGELVSPEELDFFERYIRWLVSGTRPDSHGTNTAESLLRGALSFEKLPAPTPDFDLEIAATVHRANVVTLVEDSGHGPG
jgi:glyoxylase-like metal-dependent hydrolase (beta-lactamase superfamily II)